MKCPKCKHRLRMYPVQDLNKAPRYFCLTCGYDEKENKDECDVCGMIWYNCLCSHDD